MVQDQGEMDIQTESFSLKLYPSEDVSWHDSGMEALAKMDLPFPDVGGP